MERSKPAKRIGRPTKPPIEGERVPLGLRVTAEAKRKLEEAAIKSGRSISQEAELRIERSFLDDRLAAIEEHFKGWRIGLDKLNQWVEQVFGPDGLFGPDSRPTQSREWSPAAKALDEDFLHEEKRRDEQRRQIREAAKALHEDFLREKKRREKKREELSDEELSQIRQHQEEQLKALIERRKKWDAEDAESIKRVQERFDKEMEARYGPSKGNKS